MGMLTKEDINQIGEMMDVRIEATLETKLEAKFVKFEERVVGRVVEEVGEMIEQNLFPKFDEMDAKIAALPTKDYLDEKIGGLKDIFVMKKKPRPGFLLQQS